jgi:hypothetical protein
MRAHLGTVALKPFLDPAKYLLYETEKGVIACEERRIKILGMPFPLPDFRKEYVLSADRDFPENLGSGETFNGDNAEFVDILTSAEDYRTIEMTHSRFHSLLDVAEEIRLGHYLAETLYDARAKEAANNISLANKLLPESSIMTYLLSLREVRTPENIQKLRAAVFDRAKELEDIFPEYIDYLARHHYGSDIRKYV